MRAEPFFLAVQLALLALAVVALAVAPLHHAARARAVVAAGPLDDRPVVLQAESVPGVVLRVEDDGLCGGDVDVQYENEDCETPHGEHVESSEEQEGLDSVIAGQSPPYPFTHLLCNLLRADTESCITISDWDSGENSHLVFSI